MPNKCLQPLSTCTFQAPSRHTATKAITPTFWFPATDLRSAMKHHHFSETVQVRLYFCQATTPTFWFPATDLRTDLRSAMKRHHFSETVGVRLYFCQLLRVGKAWPMWALSFLRPALRQTLHLNLSENCDILCGSVCRCKTPEEEEEEAFSGRSAPKDSFNLPPCLLFSWYLLIVSNLPGHCSKTLPHNWHARQERTVRSLWIRARTVSQLHNIA
jgi:hypothetical protein